MTNLNWAIVFLIAAIVLAIMGFGVLAAGAAAAARVLFYIFLALFVITLIMSVARRA